MHDTHFFLDEEDWERLATVYRPDGAGGLDAIAGTVEDGPTIFSVDAVTDRAATRSSAALEPKSSALW